MAGIGATGIILIVLIGLILFGPSKLPELGKAFGRTLREFKNGSRELLSEPTQPPGSSAGEPRDASGERQS